MTEPAIDLDSHTDGSRECRPVIEFTPEQQATLNRLAAIPPSMLDAHAARLEQVTKFGHSDDADALEPIDYFARKARDYACDAIDHARRGSGDIAITRLKLVKVAALALAGIDRLDLIKQKGSAR
jgi:hypothetical protein